jgi:hypothetical protein
MFGIVSFAPDPPSGDRSNRIATTRFVGSSIITTPVTVANGGTGTATLTAHAVLLGEGAATLGFAIASNTVGWLLTSNGSTSDPSFQAPPTSTKQADQQTFTTAGTALWTKPSGFGAKAYVLVQLWGGGGGGGRSSSGNTAGGGAGGSYNEGWFTLASINSTVTVTIGTGGLGATSATSGLNGGNSSFGSLITAFGGQGGPSSGAGGIAFGASSLGGSWTGRTDATGALTLQVILFEGGNGAGTVGGTNNFSASNALKGGAGGGGSNSGGAATAAGTSMLGGNGGAGGATPGRGIQPGGGGGASTTANTNGTTGGTGQVIVTVFDGA